MTCIHKYVTKKDGLMVCLACYDNWGDTIDYGFAKLGQAKPSEVCTHDTINQRGRVVECVTCGDQFLNFSLAHESQQVRRAERLARREALEKLRMGCEHTWLELVGLDLRCKKCSLTFQDTNELNLSRQRAIEYNKPKVDNTLNETIRKLKVLFIQLKAQGIIS